ncbi:MAG: hypothetical protein HGA44_02725, partial [Cellulomonadaceae bacterium]|nr:hypothetical protein [Cellulomonadaceae bacterium]
WRVALETWCRAQLTAMAQHPWIGQTALPAALGPHRLAWLERGLAALDGTALSPAQRTAVVGRLSLHLLGEAQLLGAVAAQGQAGRAEGRASGPVAPTHPALVDYAGLLGRLADPSVHPAITAALAAGAFGDDEGDVDQVGFGLALLLDGVQALVDRSTRTGDRIGDAR